MAVSVPAPPLKKSAPAPPVNLSFPKRPRRIILEHVVTVAPGNPFYSYWIGRVILFKERQTKFIRPSPVVFQCGAGASQLVKKE